MFSSNSLEPTPEQKEWDRTNRRIAWTFLIAIAVLGATSLGSATWITLSNLSTLLAMYLNDVEDIDRTAEETARQGLSRIILITTAFIFFFFKARDALAIAYSNLGERPTTNRAGRTTQSH